MSSQSHRCLSAFLDAGALPAHLASIRAEYRDRRDAMLDALERHFPPTARWSEPVGGMFVWVSLPTGRDTMAILRHAMASERVAFVPGAAFCARDPRQASHCMRLCFASVSVEKIEEGIARLSRVL